MTEDDKKVLKFVDRLLSILLAMYLVVAVIYGMITGIWWDSSNAYALFCGVALLFLKLHIKKEGKWLKKI